MQESCQVYNAYKLNKDGKKNPHLEPERKGIHWSCHGELEHMKMICLNFTSKWNGIKWKWVKTKHCKTYCCGGQNRYRTFCSCNKEITLCDDCFTDHVLDKCDGWRLCFLRVHVFLESILVAMIYFSVHDNTSKM